MNYEQWIVNLEYRQQHLAAAVHDLIPAQIDSLCSGNFYNGLVFVQNGSKWQRVFLPR